jgi:3-oxoacyl-[acyl-carrier protein] reductase
MRDEDWDQVLAVDLSGPFRLTRACVRSMMRRQWGRIINLASVVGAMGNAGQVNYAAAKAGLIGFSRSLAREVGSRHITVNVVAPGFIATDMTSSLPQAQREALVAQTPAGRLGTPDDVAVAVAFLASDEAAFITGQTLHVNGGLYMG